MRRTFSRVISSLLIAGVLMMSSGCFASFNLTRKVYNFNKGVGDKWVNELVFLVMIVVPVYSIAALVDMVILNSIEFWTGTNPVSASNDQRTIPLPETGVTVTLNGSDKSVRILQEADGKNKELTFERAGDETIVKNANGEVLVRCQATEEGGMELKDAAGNVISTYSKTDLEQISQRLSIAN